MMFYSEVNNFILKFHQLWQAGYNAHLNVDSHAGYAWCGLRVDLGAAPAAPRHQQVRPGPRRHAPSYRRRLEARAAARAAASEDAEKATEDATGTAEEAGETQEAAAEEAAAAMRVTEAIVAVGTGVAATAKKIAEEAEARKAAEEAAKKKDCVKDDPGVRKKPSDWPGPKWWCDTLGTYKHYHGNMKFLISKELQRSMNYHAAEITHATFLRLLWVSMRTIPMNRECFQPEGWLTEVFGTDVVKWTSLRDCLAPHVYFNSSKTSVFSGKKLED